MSKEVIITGGGIAGIYSAYLLSNQGYRVKLIEANSYIGGKCRSFIDKISGEEIDNGQHLFMGAYTHFLGLIENISDINNLKIFTGLHLDIFSSGGKKYSLSSGNFSGKLGMIRALFKLDGISRQSKFNIIKLFLKIPFIKAEDYNISATKYLMQNGQSSEIIRIFWEPLILAVCNTTPSTASAKLLINVLKKSFLSDDYSSKIILSKVGLSQLLKNFDDYLKARNGEIIYNTSIKSIIIENKKAIGIETNKGEIYNADIIISSLPYYSLEKVLSDELYFSDFFKSLKFYKNSSIMSVYLWYQREIVTDDYFAMIDSNVQWVFNRRNYINTEPEITNKFKGHLTVTISDADRFNNMTKYEIIDLITDDLEIAIPEIKNNKLLHYQIIKEKRATFTATHEIEKFRLKQCPPIDSLYVVGDWTDTSFPATIEGACISADIAVKNILKSDTLLS